MTNETNSRRRHPAKLVSFGDQQAEIDVELAPLIEHMWRAGIKTIMCCQETDPGIAWIEFDSPQDLLHFLNLVVWYEPGLDSLYGRVNWQRTAVEEPGCWEFQLHLMDIFENQKEQNEDGFAHFTLNIGVYFPKYDIQELYERFANLPHKERAAGPDEKAEASVIENIN